MEYVKAPEQEINTHRDSQNLSFLQRHVAFFDKNKDGVVYPPETFKGFRAIGFGLGASLAASVAINLAMSYPTLPSRIPNPLLPIYINNIQKAKHGSDAQGFDAKGNFDREKFEEIFTKYAITHGDALTQEEMETMVKAKRDDKGWFGRLAAKVEWAMLYKIAKDENGLLHKEAVRGMYDGTLFEYLENKKNANAPKS